MYASTNSLFLSFFQDTIAQEYENVWLCCTQNPMQNIRRKPITIAFQLILSKN